MIAEDHHPEIHVIPRAIEAATGGAALQVFGEDYPRPMDVPRDYIHVCDLADAHVAALGALESGAPRALTMPGRVSRSRCDK